MLDFNEMIRWSRLSRFGKSNLAKLTIVTPFLGFLIFLNTGLEDYVSLGPDNLTDTWLSYWADRRIELLYLGLSLLGAATGLFSLLAPDTVKNSKQYSDYIQFKEDTKTANAVTGSLEVSLDDCYARHFGDGDSFHDIPTTWEFPEKLKDSIYRLTISTFEKSEGIFLDEMDSNQPMPEEPDVSYYMYNGLPNIDPIFDCVVHRRRLEFGMWKSFFSVAPEFSIDVFRLEYLRKDYSTPGLRCFVFVMFVIGSLLALFPTFVSISMVVLISF